MMAVIMAGGRGTRIASVNNEVPKPMIKVYGIPILEYQIIRLVKEEIRNIIIIVGYLGNVIEDYFGNGYKFGASITYYRETFPLGTAGALFKIYEKLEKDFFLINGDIIFNINFLRMMEYHKNRKGKATIFVHPNSHPYDSALIQACDDGRVVNWINKENEREWNQNKVNAGIHILKSELFQVICGNETVDLDRDILKNLIKKNCLYAYNSPEYVKDMGTPERLAEVESDIRSGLIDKRNLNRKQKAIFLDRDGTINLHKGFLNNIEEFVLVEGVAHNINYFHEKGYLVIVVTNQPIIARGEISWNELYKIHDKMETLLGRENAYVDDIFICPHHQDKGFKGERIEYKIECNCRKPEAGLLFEAAKKYNIDLKQSYMIGDSETDMEAARRAGCCGILIEPNLKWKVNIR